MFSGAFGRNKKGHRPKVIKETTDFSDKILRRNVAVNILAIKLLTIIKHENQRIHVKHEGKKFLNKSVTDRSSLRRCSVKKVFLKILQNSQENNCARVSLLIKLKTKACNFIKKRIWHRCFLVNFAKFARTPFSQNTSGRLPL